MRILIVEDEIKLAAYLKRGLEGQGYAVDVAADGEQGLWQATNESYDVIVLDIMLPKMNGYLVCRRLRELGMWTPILMLTARSSEGDKVLGFEVGADDYLTKPFSTLELMARVRALLRRASADPPQPVLTTGRLTIDPSRRDVVCN